MTPKRRTSSICFVPELLFLLSSSQKVLHGGAFPLLVGAGLFALMMTWKRGRDILSQRFREQLLPLTDFFDILTVERPCDHAIARLVVVEEPGGEPDW